MEKHSMLALSTTHITENTRNALDNNAISDIVSYNKDGLGYFIPICLNLEEYENSECPADLYSCIRYAISHGFNWIMFDRDVEPTPELIQY